MVNATRYYLRASTIVGASLPGPAGSPVPQNHAARRFFWTAVSTSSQLAYPPHGDLLLLVVRLNRMNPCNMSSSTVINNFTFHLTQMFLLCFDGDDEFEYIPFRFDSDFLIFFSHHRSRAAPSPCASVLHPTRMLVTHSRIEEERKEIETAEENLGKNRKNSSEVGYIIDTPCSP
jgi:hypothetical protein